MSVSSSNLRQMALGIMLSHNPTARMVVSVSHQAALACSRSSSFREATLPARTTAHQPRLYATLLRPAPVKTSRNYYRRRLISGPSSPSDRRSCATASATRLLKWRDHAIAENSVPRYPAGCCGNEATKEDLLAGREECASRPGRHRGTCGDPESLVRPMRDKAKVVVLSM